jgi:hypothetical protein
MKLAIEDTLVLVTSALFVDHQGKQLSKPSPERKRRIEQTVISLSLAGFNDFLLLDNTIPRGYFEEGELGILKAFTLPCNVSLPINEFQLNGPSRLEAVLLMETAMFLMQNFSHVKYILKVSAGYQIRNIHEIMDKAGQGIVFRMGSPFRQKIKFCLTSFYILPIAEYFGFVQHLTDNIDEISHTKPLEHHMYTYIQSIPHQLIAAPYPRLAAHFITSNKTTNDLSYRLKELVFSALSKLGLYAYTLK